MPDFMVAHVPTNYRDDWGRLEVEGDVYNICERLAELSPNLRLRDRREAAEDGGYRWIVSEIDLAGKECWVMGIHHGELDARVIKQIEYILGVPFEKRFAESERLAAAYQEADKDRKLNELAESIALPMWGDLERTGFIQRRTSYPKRGVTGGRGHLL